MVKVTIDSRGVVQETGSGTYIDVPVVISTAPQKTLTKVSAAGDATISGPLTHMNSTTAAGVTASLPTITAAMLGKEYIILKSSGSNPCLISGTQGITEGGAWTLNVDTSRAVTLMAATGSTAMYWHVLGNYSLDNG